MNSIFRALFAHWLLIAVSTTACLLGGLWVIATATPRYEGSARVVLDYVRPDPQTGQVLPSKMLDAYLQSQLKMLRDVQVAATAADMMGWMDSPDVLSAYANRPPEDTRDLQSWVAAILIPRTGAEMVDGSNILKISYYGENPELSRIAADALRAAYVQSDITSRQSAALESATRLGIRLAQVRSQLDTLVAMQARMSQETGVSLGARGRDQSSIELTGLLDQNVRPVVEAPPAEPSMTARELAQARQSLDVAQRTLGPNHPGLVQLKARVQMLSERVATELTSVQTQRQLIDASNAAAQAQVEALKARVLAQRQPALRLRLLQDQIDVRTEEVNALSQGVMASRANQSTKATSIVPIGEATANEVPVFPNKLLILAGSGGLGLILGGMMACLVEISSRRVRNARHIENATGSVLLGVLPAMVALPQAPRARRRKKAGRGPDVLVEATAV